MSQSVPEDITASAPSPKPSSYLLAIRAAQSDPQQLEQLFQSARRTRAVPQFRADLVASYQEAPANVLYGAWYYRLQHAGTHAEQDSRRSVSWTLAVPLSVCVGLLFWLLSDPHLTVVAQVPYLAVLWAPITALFIIAFLALAARRSYWRAGLVAVALVAATAYVLTVLPRLASASQQTYLTLMLAHVPLLAWGAVGIALLGWRAPAQSQFAFLWKSIEVSGTAGVAAIAGGIFVGLTYGMFQALGIALPELILRLLIAGGAGLIPVLAVAAVYDPSAGPSEQEFGRGFGRILAILMQALLPLTLIVLVIYLCFIPFNFVQPFVNRDVLIVYNVMLFAVMGLLIGVTPVGIEDLSPRLQRALRTGIVALAALVVLVSLYALAAVVYRTAHGTLTMNRLTVIGWNVINVGLLVVLLYKQLRLGRAGWVDALHATFRLGALAYLIWVVLLVLALPWVF
jgi:hypothetical protein